MAALAALVNKAVPDDKSINLFFNTGKAQLGISLQSGTDKDDQATDIWQPGDNDYNGYILNPSSLAAALYRGLNYVVGVTTPRLDAGATQTENQISLVSPVYQRLTATTLENTNVALCVTPDGDSGWLYYLIGQSPNVRTLLEFDLKTGTSQSNVIPGVAVNASLAAFYDETDQKRHVIFEGGGLVDYIVQDTSQVNLPSPTMAKNPALAVVYSPSNKKTYVYYGDINSSIWRATRTQSGWEATATLVAGAPKIAELSKLTVVQANNINHLFYIAKDAGGAQIKAFSDFTHVRDPVS